MGEEEGEGEKGGEKDELKVQAHSELTCPHDLDPLSQEEGRG